MDALILIDYQQEYFDPSGILGEKHIRDIPIIQNTINVIEHFRQNNLIIIWVKSIYDNVKNKSHLTYFDKKPCCQKDSPLSQVYSKLISYISDNDIILTKKYYSSFIDTNLFNILKENNVKNIFISGTTIRTSILQTIIDAYQMNFDVKILGDCCAIESSKINNVFNKYGDIVEIINTTDIIKDKLNIISNENTYLLNFDFPDLFDQINSEIIWSKMYNRKKPVMRLVSLCGDVGNNPVYRHPTDCQPQLQDWTPTVKTIKDKIEEIVNMKFNHVLIQKYRDGEDNVGEHSDKTLDILPNSYIVNFSIGATRTMVIKNKETNDKIKIKLKNNSCLIMSLLTNANWLHSIIVDKRDSKEKTKDELIHNGERISLTFRCIGTFINDGKLIGQGAPKYNKTPWYDNLTILHAFSAENHLTNFDYEKYYGCGFGTVDFKLSKYAGFEINKYSTIVLNVNNHCTNIPFTDLLVVSEINDLIKHKLVLIVGDLLNFDFSLLKENCQFYYVLIEFVINYNDIDCMYELDNWKDLLLFEGKNIKIYSNDQNIIDFCYNKGLCFEIHENENYIIDGDNIIKENMLDYLQNKFS